MHINIVLYNTIFSNDENWSFLILFPLQLAKQEQNKTKKNACVLLASRSMLIDLKRDLH